MMKRDVPSVYSRIIVGLLLGFVLCNVAHAEPTGGGTGRFEPVPELGEATGGDIWGAGHNGQLRIVEVFPLCHGGEVDPLCYDTDAHHFVTSCQVQMEAAMRAMDEFVDQKQKDYESYDGCNYCDSRGCTLLACPSGSNEVARLEWELKKAKETAVTATKKAIAAKQWRDAKACWRKP